MKYFRWVLLHLLSGELPVREYALLLDLFALFYGQHLIGKVFESNLSITVLIKPVEEIFYVPIQAKDAV